MFRRTAAILAAAAILALQTALPASAHPSYYIGEQGSTSGCFVPQKVTTVINAPYSHHHQLQVQPPYGTIYEAHSYSSLATFRTSIAQPGNTNNPGYVVLAASSFQFSTANSYWTCST